MSFSLVRTFALIACGTAACSLSAQNTFTTRALSAEFSLEVNAINGTTVGTVDLTGANGALDPADGFLVSVSDFGLGVMWNGSLEAEFINNGPDPVTLNRSSTLRMQVLAPDATVIASRSLGSTPGIPEVVINPGETYVDNYSGGGGSGTASLSPHLVPYFNQPTPAALQTVATGVLVNLPAGLDVASTSGVITGEATLSGTLRYFNDFIWNQAGGGDFASASSWRIGAAIPSGAGTHVAFGRSITGDSVVLFNEATHLGKLYFDSPDHSYTLRSGSPAHTLTLSGTAANRGIEVRTGAHTIETPLIVTQGANGSGFSGPSGVPLYLFDNTQLRLTGGVSGAGHLLKQGEGTLEFSDVVSTAAMHVSDGLVRFVGIGHAGNIYANISEFTPGLESLATVEFALSNSVSFTGAYLRSSQGFFGTATGGVLRVTSDSGRAHTLTLAPSAASTYQDGTDLISGHIAVAHNQALGTGALRVAPAAADQAALSASGGLRTLANTLQLLSHDLTILGEHELRLDGVISGPGALVKHDAGRLRLRGNNTFSGGMHIHAGTVEAALNNALGTGATTVYASATLQINSGVTIANRINLLSGSTLILSGIAQDVSLQGGSVGGTGQIGGTVGGSGLLSPGNSEGILTIQSIDPSAGLDFAFRFTALAPDFSTPAASLNDVILLTDLAAPFAAPLGLDNTVSVYFGSELGAGDVIIGGIVTAAADLPALLAAVQGADFRFYYESIGGTVDFEERQYITLPGTDVVIDISLFTDAGVDYAALEFTLVAVPEPANVAVLMALAAALSHGLRRPRARPTRAPAPPQPSSAPRPTSAA